MQTLSSLGFRMFGGACVALLIAGQASGQAVANRVDVETLLRAMTLEEKVAQLNQIGGGEPLDGTEQERADRLDALLARARSGAAGTFLGGCGAAHLNRVQEAVLSGSRHNIPALFAHDVIHGYRTIFPTPLAESCAWDLDLAERTAAAAAAEARAAGVRWTFAPMVDVARDPRWGRIVEGAGEDPFLGAQLAAARIRGFQGPDFDGTGQLADHRVLACAKHFAAYGAAEGGRDYNTVDISPLTLHQVYLPPFKAAAEAHVASYMTAFNELNGVPCTASRGLLVDTLRSAWGFDGVVVTDYTAIMELTRHRFARDAQHAARLAIDAQVDIDMVSEHFAQKLPDLVRSGAVSEASIDRAARRVLRLKQMANLFDRPFTDTSLEAETLLSPKHRALAREAAARSIILLKNDREVLPLRPSSSIRSIAVVGPLADRGRDALGAWACTGRGEEAVTPLAGIRALAEEFKLNVTFAPGCDADTDSSMLRNTAVDAASHADLIIAVVGEPEALSGEAHSRSLIELPLEQQRLLESIKATGKPLVVALMTGRPLAISWIAENADALLVIWHGGSEAGNGLADVLAGKVNPSARLTTSFPRNVGQIPIYYNYKPTGRPNNPADRYTTGYVDTPITPLYAFGYGLSYTQFSLSSPRVSTGDARATDFVTLEVDVRNTGVRRGAEVVQWYASVPFCSVTRPVKELVAFERVELDPGQTMTVQARIPATRLGYLDATGRLVFENAIAHIHAAGGNVSSPPVQIRLLSDSTSK